MEKKSSSINFNSLLTLIAIGAIGWNASTTLKLSEHMTRVETLLEVRAEQVSLIERRVSVMEGLIGAKPKTQ